MLKSAYHPNLQLGAHVFIGDRVVLQDTNGGLVELAKRVHLYTGCTKWRDRSWSACPFTDG